MPTSREISGAPDAPAPCSNGYQSFSSPAVEVPRSRRCSVRRPGLQFVKPILLVGVILSFFTFFGLQRDRRLGGFLRKPQEPVVVDVKSARFGGLLAQSAGIAAGALIVKRSYLAIRRHLQQRAQSLAKLSAVQEIQNATYAYSSLTALGMEPGNLFKTESVRSNEDVTEGLMLLGSGFDASGCFGSNIALKFVGTKDSLLSSIDLSGTDITQRKLKKLSNAALEGLAKARDPTIISMTVKKPVSSATLLRTLKDGLTSTYDKGQRGDVYQLANFITSELRPHLEKRLSIGTGLRFDILPTTKTSDQPGELACMVEILLSGKTVGMLASTLFAKQLINMVVGPHPLSKGAKLIVMETANKAIEDAKTETVAVEPAEGTVATEKEN